MKLFYKRVEIPPLSAAPLAFSDPASLYLTSTNLLAILFEL